ncbi:MAG: DUF262 domain-containing protein [Bacteroidales bacterium]|nr:DUF262 domain-containing protein [Bacteroidales bacterium]MDY6348696.1 DUF262 domain-containing protein [Bacteroidales bacterium]
MAENKAENKIELKSVSELLGRKFFIPSYQRGYRWTEQQVKDLLNDVNEFRPETVKDTNEETWYCLQPLVVRKLEESDSRLEKEADKTDWYEVIDGQQRLTTIFLTIHYFNEMWVGKLKTPLPTIKYATRTDGFEFLNCLEINDNQKAVAQGMTFKDYIDYHFMKLAYSTIHKWAIGMDKTFNNNDFQSKFIYRTKVIWYESVDEDPIKVFTRLNIGKISLTNAELIKALFLNRSNFHISDDNHLKLRQQEIASEWDTIEYTLQNDEFWLFLHEKGYDRPTRIDFIFDLMCEQETLGKFENIGTDDYKTFRYFYEYFKSDSSNIEDCWKEVKNYFQTFKEWFDDLELYHYIGYLVEYKHSISGLVSEWHSSKDKDSFVSYLKAEIKKKIKGCPALDFQHKEDGSDKGKCKPILLFQNIQTIINQNKNNLSNEDYKLGVFYKFPFHLYKLENWNVEHINSNTTNDEEDADIQKEWLLNVYLSADDDTQKIIRSFFESSEDEKGKLFEKVKQIIPQNEEWTSAEKNRIWNYTLLDSSTNRSYGNAIFSGKRRVIIGKDKGLSIAIPKISKDGKLQLGEEQKAKSSFVPPCTKQVFMKYYSATMSDANYWTKVDAEGYLKNIEDCIKKLEE